MEFSAEIQTEKKAEGWHYHITGIVQGVGFRPFVYQTAVTNHLTGNVCNSADGVLINVFGIASSLKLFDRIIRTSPPPRARIDQIERTAIPFQRLSEFVILASRDNESDFLPVSPDIAVCSSCRKEILDPADRRFYYPFNNCTNCGPRFSIIEKIPYDRPNTSMRKFPMCQPCAAEYQNPLDRRFHAQPVACAVCGPQLTFFSKGSEPLTGEAALTATANSLRAGVVTAIKGIGGFHLAYDALNESSLTLLRERKQRSGKPFALMAKNISVIEKYCLISPAEKEALESAAAPIVLLRKKTDCTIPESVAPTQKNLGFMLPYTPLHILLFEALSPEIEVLVMTSANHSEEPIVYGDTGTDMNQLWSLSDAILTHNRPIVTRIDDSVLRIGPDDQPVMIRRARGYAPNPIRVDQPMNEILAVGPELKNTFCLTRGFYAFVSHHIGDMENAETFEAFEQGIEHYKALFRINPQAIVCDLHPNYLSTGYAEKTAKKLKLPLFRVQHHFAHIASVLAEHNRFSDKAAIGLAFDGTGYGTDGTIWGGEVMLCNEDGFERLYHLDPFPLPGGDAAIRKPARQALSLLYANGLEWENEFHPVKALPPREKALLKSQLDHQLNCVNTSSMGRLFDAVSSLTGVCQNVTYEGQAAIELENIADKTCNDAYRFEIIEDRILVKPMLLDIIRDLHQGIEKTVISARFHQAVIRLCLEICVRIRNGSGTDRIQPGSIDKEKGMFPVVLSGGVWQNQVLLTGVRNLLSENGFKVLLPVELPFNDGCIAFGQAMIANTILSKERNNVSRNSGKNHKNL